MGRVAVHIAEFWVCMNDLGSIMMPVMGELSRQGNLLSADRPLADLHARAGGIDGGIVACPALFSLGQIVSTLQMRLARAIMVSDGRDNLELWVEAEPKDENVQLTILNWRTCAPAIGGAVPDIAVATSGPQLYFDHALRLVGSRGAIGGLLSTSDFGSEARPLFVKMLGHAHEEVIDDLKHFRPFERTRLLLPDGRRLDMSGFPVNSIGAPPMGYVCQLHFRDGDLVRESAPASTSGALFGKNLAPALRQPLNRIIANAETIGGELLGPIRENYATYARDIANAARHLAALVDDLGDLEAVERADFSTAKDHIELGDIARRVAGLLALKAADHSIHFRVPDERTYVPATAEFRRVLQIMLNLGTNAIRYSPDGSVVTITAETRPDCAILRVSDEGAGIKVEDRDRVFEKFERLGRTGDGGSGLGLYISRRLARAMGGDLTVSATEGGGAAITLRLPR